MVSDDGGTMYVSLLMLSTQLLQHILLPYHLTCLQLKLAICLQKQKVILSYADREGQGLAIIC